METLKEVDFSEFKIPMAVLYFDPTDHPGKAVVRIWEAAVTRPTDIIITRETIQEAREDIKAAGFTVCYPRADCDDPCIVESWM